MECPVSLKKCNRWVCLKQKGCAGVSTPLDPISPSQAFSKMDVDLACVPLGPTNQWEPAPTSERSNAVKQDGVEGSGNCRDAIDAARYRKLRKFAHYKKMDGLDCFGIYFGGGFVATAGAEGILDRALDDELLTSAPAET